MVTNSMTLPASESFPLTSSSDEDSIVLNTYINQNYKIWFYFLFLAIFSAKILAFLFTDLGSSTLLVTNSMNSTSLSLLWTRLSWMMILSQLRNTICNQKKIIFNHYISKMHMYYYYINLLLCRYFMFLLFKRNIVRSFRFLYFFWYILNLIYILCSLFYSILRLIYSFC